jgi:hypothetical protein
VWRLLPALLWLGVLAACTTDTGELVARDIVSTIPWNASETARYRLLQGDEVKGTGDLELLQEADGTRITQNFAFVEAQITDVVEAFVDSETLRPRSVERVINGPEGERSCQAVYDSGTVTINQQAEEDERSDQLTVPPEHYDSWSDLYLWRTIEFFEGNEVRYVDVSTCSLARPDMFSPVLRVIRIEDVEVPAGNFRAWRLEFRAEGRTQRVWYADTETKPLVRYDNGDLVFELESIN